MTSPLQASIDSKQIFRPEDAELRRLEAMFIAVAFNDQGLCWGCQEHGVAVKRGQPLAAHVSGCRVAKAMAGK
jgi:hypothetical protein